jgi:hypothetical protein
MIQSYLNLRNTEIVKVGRALEHSISHIIQNICGS